MAFKLPFFDKDSDTVEDIKSKGNALMHTAFGLGPLAFASYSTMNKIKSNNPNFLSSAPTNQMGDIHSNVGESFSRYNLMRSKVKEASKVRLQKQFEDVDKFITKLSGETMEAKSAFLANLKVVLSDPNMADDMGEVMRQVDGMLDDAFSGVDFTSTKKQELTDLVTTIRDSNAGSDRLSKVAGYSSGAFSPVSDLLVRPQTVNYGSLKSSSNAFSASGQFDKNPVVKMLRESFGKQVNFKFNTRQEKVGNVFGDITYAQVFKAGSDKPLQTLPIDISSNFREKGIAPIRYGNMNTTYAAPMVYANAPALAEATSHLDAAGRRAVVSEAFSQLQRGISSNADITRNALFLTPEMGIATMFARDVIGRGGLGRVSSRDISLINQNIQQSLEYIDRNNMGSSSLSATVNDFLGYKFSSTGQRMALMNPMSIPGSAQRGEFRPMLAQMYDMFDISATPFGQGHFGTSMGDIGLTGSGATAASGGSLTSQATIMSNARALFGGLLTNRATQPITARFRQMHNREEFLLGSKPVGHGGPSTIAIMDVTGKQRFGLGEGTANYFGETRVVKPINKPIYNPEAFGGASNILLEELKYRAEIGTSSLDGIDRNLRIGMDTNTNGKFFTAFEGDIDGRKISSLLGGQDGLIAKRGLKDSVTLDGNKLIYSNIDDFYKLFGDPKSSSGLYLGMIDSRRQVFDRYSGISGFEMGIGEVTSGRGFEKISITGSRIVDNPYMKLFSTMFKGTIEKTSLEAMRSSLIERGNLNQTTVNRILNRVGGTDISGVFVSESSMLKKAPMNLAEQIGSSLSALGRGSVTKQGFSHNLQHDIFKNLLPDYYKSEKGVQEATSMWNQKSVKAQSQQLIESAIGLAVKEHHQTGVASNFDEIGLTFGYFRQLYEKPGADIHGVTKERFENIYKQTLTGMGFDSDSYDMASVEKSIRRGLAIGVTETAIGPQASTLGQNMGSMEPRLYNFLSHKLIHDMGVERKVASDFMFSMLSRKAGTGENIELLKEYTKTMSSMSSRQLFEPDIKRVSVNEFMNIDDDVRMREFLAKQDGGFMLDFSLNKDLEARVRTQGRHNLPSQVYIPAGENFLSNLDIERTLIPGEEGFKEIDADYIRSLTRFSQGLQKVSTAGVVKDSLENVTAFKESMAQFFGMSFRSTLRGKMQGSTFALGGSVDLGRFDDRYLGFSSGSPEVFNVDLSDGKLTFSDTVGYDKKEKIYQDIASDIDRDHFGKYRQALIAGDDAEAKRLVNAFHITSEEMNAYQSKGLGSVNYTQDQKYLMRKIQRVSGGAATFQDSSSFLNAMSSFISGSTPEGTMSRAASGADAKQALFQGRRDARKNVASLLQHFFLGSHAGSTPSSSNFAILGRHPMVGMGHMQFVRTFRDVRENTGIDAVFQKFRGTEGGEKSLEGFKKLTGKEFKSFNDMLLFMRKDFGSAAGESDLINFLEYRNAQRQTGIADAISNTSDVDSIAKLTAEHKELTLSQSSIADYRSGNAMSSELKASVGELGSDLKGNRKKLLNSLFMSMTYHMGEISSGVGGGRVVIPEMMTEVHYGGQKRTIDMSIASGMIGDFDGDIYQLLYPTRKSAASIGLHGSGANKSLVELNKQGMLYRAKTQVLFEMASDGIKNIAEKMKGGNMDRTLMEQIRTHALQEEMGKNVGPLDVSLDALRLGVINTADASNLEVSRDVINMLSVIQEVANIKAKKLPDAIPLAQALSTNINRLIENPGSEKELTTLEGYFRNFIFSGSNVDDLAFENVTVKGGGMDSIVGEALEGQRVISLSNRGTAPDPTTYIMDRLRQVLPHVSEAGYLHQKTERRLGAASLQENRTMMQVFQGMLENSAQGKIAGEIREDYLMSDIEDAIGKINSLMKRNAMEITSNGRMGAIGVGLAASLALGSAIGYGGYDPTPLQVGGEYVSPDLKAAIRDGSALNAGASPEDMENMQNSVHNDIMNRQINVGETMMIPGNNFNIRGQAVNRRAINDLSQMVAAMGGSSHFSMNDTRSPITQHYVDRTYFGE